MKLKHLFENEMTAEIFPEEAYNYAYRTGKRNPELESFLLQNIEYNSWMVLNYTKNVIKYRWPEAEHGILQRVKYISDHVINDYAENVIKGRWPEVEPLILKKASCAYSYARNVIKGRWPEAEPYIKKNPSYWNAYLRVFPEVRTPSKNIPTVLCRCALIDVPNTASDEQILQIIKLVCDNQSVSIDDVWRVRTYDEQIIKQKLEAGKLTKINIRGLKGPLKTRFKRIFGDLNKTSDFD